MVKKKKSGPPPKDIKGLRFSRLVACDYMDHGKWSCMCDCGEPTVVHGADLRRGKVKSCGCLQLEVAKTGDCRRQHGMSETPEYGTYKSMLNRCANPLARGYHRYGGRGIKVCDRWLESFENFFADMGIRPKATTIDRIDVNGDYKPENCRWASAEVQAANTTTAILITALGETMPIGAWARKLGMSDKALRYRLTRMTPEEAITRPLRKHTKW